MKAPSPAHSTALVADIGGTWVRFALARGVHGEAPSLSAYRKLPVAGHATVVDAARDYLRALDVPSVHPDAAVFAVAGRVDGDRASMTNHPWHLHAPACADALDIGHVTLVNDFAAQALAVPHLAAHERVQLGGRARTFAADADVTFPVLGPGTGLGVSALLRRGGHAFALASEGGHASFAPKTERQRDVLARLAARYPRVSYERLVSGGGLSNLHFALAQRAGIAEPPAMTPEQVTAAAHAGDPLARETIEVFCEVFGALAGDLVLTFGGWDGVFLSGGLVPLLLDDLAGDAFRQAFEAKGRFSGAMREVPVHAVTHAHPGLLGAAALALEVAAADALA